MTLHRLSRNATQPAVGRDVEAWCNKCGRGLTHVIVAMVGLEVVRVRCNTCGGEHKYKSTQEAAESSPRQSARVRAPATPRQSQSVVAKAAAANQAERATRALYDRAMADRDRATALPYTMALQPKAGQLVDHKLFGYGVVDALYDGKARFLFQDGYKILVTGREG
jgi:hypothetical protein